MRLYFAYGSNLDRQQMQERCPGAKVVGPARLPGHRLEFAGHSARWGGGVATVTPAAGPSVDGILYQLPPEDLAALDALEGHPFVYRRRVRSVVDGAGRARKASVYIMDEAEPTPVGPRYLEVLRTEYRRLGFSEQHLLAAARLPEGWHRVFVYGTLMRGEANHRLLALPETEGEARLDGAARTVARYHLVDMGMFPAMLEHGQTVVEGEVWTVSSSVLADLDRLESHPRFYRRSAICLEDGLELEAYLLPPGRAAGHKAIEHGSWRRWAGHGGARCVSR